MKNISLIGTEYGGFYYPTQLPELNENSVIYCVGAGEDITHDVILRNVGIISAVFTLISCVGRYNVLTN